MSHTDPEFLAVPHVTTRVCEQRDSTSANGTKGSLPMANGTFDKDLTRQQTRQTFKL